MVHGGGMSSILPMFHSQLSHSSDLAVAIFLITTGVVSVMGNGVVLLFFGRKRKKLRPHELMTINLAVCDLGYSLFGVPFPIASSLSHAWVFGEAGCLFYGVQGFVFGIGSLITTCLISLDRSFKICSIQYGQWIDRRRASLCIVLVWIYTIFWGLLPVFGFGSYGPEPYATSCTIDWWRMKSSLNDRVYIFLILSFCFGIPTLIIVTSYIAIVVKVYRSTRTLASIPSSTVTNNSKELRLTKIAAVVCSSFLLAWMPYAIVSLYSALTAKEEVEKYPWILRAGARSTGQVTPKMADFLGFPTHVNWTSMENYTREMWSHITVNSSFSLGSDSVSRSGSDLAAGSVRLVSSLRPEVTLIPALFAKSHCMANPFIYQVISREFREEVCDMFCWRRQEQGRLGRRRRRKKSDSGDGRGRISLTCYHSWCKRSSSGIPSRANEGPRRQQSSGSGKGLHGSWQGSGGSIWMQQQWTSRSTWRGERERREQRNGEGAGAGRVHLQESVNLYRLS